MENSNLTETSKKLSIKKKALPSSPDAFLVKFNPSAVLRLVRSLEIKNAYTAAKKSSISLAKLRKEYDEPTVLAYLNSWILNFNDFVSGKDDKQMTEFQIEETALLIIDNYYYFTIPDIYLVFSNLKKGKYGKVFGELNGVLILRAFSSYSTERQIAFKKIEKEQSTALFLKYAKNEKCVPMPNSMKNRKKSIVTDFSEILKPVDIEKKKREAIAKMKAKYKF